MIASINPLEALEQLLLSGRTLPLIDALRDLFVDSEKKALFFGLIRQYLPEGRAEIMSWDSIEDKIGCFMRLFSERYFPLNDEYCQYAWESGEPVIDGLLECIPVEEHGYCSENYHLFQDDRDGMKAMLSLVPAPITEQAAQQSGARLPIIEEMKTLVGETIAKRIPRLGWDDEDLADMTKGTKFEPMADFAAWVANNTGNYFLDLTSENWDPYGWSPAAVEGLTADWKKAQAIEARMEDLERWLEADLPANFAELLDFLLAKDAEVERLPKSNKLIDIFAEANHGQT